MNVQPDNDELLTLLKSALTNAYALGRYDEAEKFLRMILTIQPDSIDAYNDLGIILKVLERPDEAISVYQQALELDPNNAKLHNNLANIFKENGDFEPAESHYRKALAHDPAYVDAHRNLGMLYKEFHRYDNAEASYRQALLHDPKSIKTQSNLSFLLLEQGRFEEGWKLYETRYDPQINPTFFTPALTFPQWSGESLEERSILILPEQGYGDEIQFVRYLSELKQRGASRITLLCKTPLKRLFSTLDTIDRIITSVEEIEEHDYWSFLLSLPLHMNTTLDTIPAQLPYLSVNEAWINHRITHNDTFHVGIVWRGSASHDNDHNRSLSTLSMLEPLWKITGTTFFGLQKELSAEDAALLRNTPIIDLSASMEDFADTAALISQLDLVICVDTAVAHLCGALAKPCWVLLPYTLCDWRWLQKREDSPWYPNVMRLFRQNSPNEWNKTIQEVADALEKRVQSRP
jgi:tetratricopeptide (TPR) repeat protein